MEACHSVVVFCHLRRLALLVILEIRRSVFNLSIEYFVIVNGLLIILPALFVVLDVPKMRYSEKDYKDALLYRRLYSRDGPIDGMVSAFDFENMKWK